MASVTLPGKMASRLGLGRLPSGGIFDTSGSIFTPSEGWLTVALVLGLNLTVAVFVQRSNWVEPMPRLWLTACLAFALALGVGKVKGHWLFQIPLNLLGLAVGAGACLWETAGTLTSGSLSGRFREIISRSDEWIGAVGSASISNDRMPFTLILLATIFLMVYWSTWFAFKPRWALAAILIPALGLLENQTYLPDERYPVPLTFFLLFAIMVLARFQFLTRLREWRTQGMVPRTDTLTFLINGAALAVIVLGLGWAIPTQRVVVPKLASSYQDVRQPWSDLEGQWERVFAGVPSQKATALHSFGGAMPLRGSISLGETPVFTVTTDYAAYWKAQTYDTYLGQGWVARPDQRAPAKATKASTSAVSSQFRKRDAVALKVAMLTPSDYLFTPGQPLDITVETVADAATPRTFEVNLTGPQQAPDLPRDIAAAAERIRAAQSDRAALERALPPQTKIVKEANGKLTLTRDAPAAPDILSVKAASRIKPGTSYEVLSSISVATAADLRSDGANYPRWVTDAYLQLPANLPQRVKDLGVQVTAGQRNGFDKTVAVAGFLKDGYKETFNIDSPPLNVDAVDYFLFTQRAGYSDYFASAMTVLLRASGVPARLATGYGPGAFDQQSSTFTVRIGDAHTWPEVYFPTYGWIQFEASPSYAAVQFGPRTGAGSGGESSGVSGDNSFVDPDLDFLLQQELNSNPADVIRPSQSSPVAHFFLHLLRILGYVVGVTGAVVAGVGIIVFIGWQVNFLGLSYTEGVYERMARLGTLVWHGPREGQTPGDYAYGLATHSQLPAAETATIAGAYMRGRYSKRALSGEERERLGSTWKSVRSALLGRLVQRVNVVRLFKRA